MVCLCLDVQGAAAYLGSNPVYSHPCNAQDAMVCWSRSTRRRAIGRSLAPCPELHLVGYSSACQERSCLGCLDWWQAQKVNECPDRQNKYFLRHRRGDSHRLRSAVREA